MKIVKIISLVVVGIIVLLIGISLAYFAATNQYYKIDLIRTVGHKVVKVIPEQSSVTELNTKLDKLHTGVRIVLKDIVYEFDQMRKQNADFAYAKFELYINEIDNITQIRRRYKSAYGVLLLKEVKDICQWSLGRGNNIKFMSDFDMILLVDKSPEKQEKIIEELKEKAEYCHNNFQPSK